MFSTKKLMTTAALAMGFLAVTGSEAEEELSYEISVDYMSHYVWRGMLLTDDPVIQPSITLGYGDFSFNAWGSMDVTDVNEADTDDDYRLQEVDYTLSYAFSPADGIDMEAGVIYYTFAGFDGTWEGYLSGSLSDVLLAPTLTLYYDFDEVDGYYANFSLGHDISLTDNLTLSLGTSIGFGDEDYNDVYFGVDDSGESDLVVSAGLGYTVNDNFSIGCSLAYSELLDNDIEEAADTGYGDSDKLVFGINATFTF